MKRMIFNAGMMLAAFAATAQTADNLDFEYDGIVYTILDFENKTCQTKSGYSYLTTEPKLIIEFGNSIGNSVIIPSKVERNLNGTTETYTVVAVGDYAFNNVTSISLPTTVTSIGTAAFSNNDKLTSITMGFGVNSIGSHAFAGCSALTSFTVPLGMTYIPNNMFVECKSLREVTIPASVANIGDYAFYNCSALENVKLPASLTQLGNSSFRGCSSITEIIFPDNLTSIPAYAFYSCSSLKSVTFPAALTSIGDAAFRYCSKLSEVTSYAAVIPAISGNTFSDAAYSGTLNIYKSQLSAYKGSQFWKNFTNISFIPVQGTGVSLKYSAINVVLGLTSQIQATPLPADATSEITYSIEAVSPENAISLSKEGKITGQRIGNAVVKVSCGSGYSYCNVSVVQNPSESVTISPIATPLYPGDEVQLSAVVIPTTITSPISWSSSNPEIAEVDAATGMLYAKAPGGALISAKCEGITGKLSVTVDPVMASAIQLNEESLVLRQGNSAILMATVTPENTTYPDVTWDTSDPTVATVTGGIVTATGVGQCNIRAMCGDVTANCTVTVEETPAESISINYSSLTLKPGQTSVLTAQILPETTTDKTVAWISSNPEIATITSDGLLTALTPGATTISATCGNVSATCMLNVEPIKASEIVLNFKNLSLQVNGTQQLVATVAEDVTDKTIVWSTSNEAVATVNNGMVTATGVGIATITAFNGDVNASCVVVVNPIPVESVTLLVTSSTVNVGNTLTVIPTIYPSDATNQQVVWTSSDPMVAYVSGGIVTAAAPGSVTITASCGEASASCIITVLQPARSIKLNYKSLNLQLGEMEDIIAEVSPQNTTDILSWKSSAEDVVSVNENGIVQGVGIGHATVYAYCGDVMEGCDIVVSAVAAKNVTLNTSSLTLNVSESQKLTAVVSPDNTTDPTVAWRSSDTGVATVSSDGTVKGIGAGTAVITATCGTISAQCTVTVVDPDPDSIILSYSEITLHATETFQLSAAIGGSDTDVAFNWTSSDKNVVTVSQDGLLTALQPGEAIITASYEELLAICKVTVAVTDPSLIIMEPSEVSLKTGELVSLSATVYPVYTTDKSLTWVSDNPAVATVDDYGIVNALSEGYTVITVYCGNVFAQCVVTVSNPVSDQEPGGDDNNGGDDNGGDNNGGDNNGGGDNGGDNNNGDDNGDGDDNGGDNGVEGIVADESVYNVYTLNGLKVMQTYNKDELLKLESGVYIINGKKVYLRNF